MRLEIALFFILLTLTCYYSYIMSQSTKSSLHWLCCSLKLKFNQNTIVTQKYFLQLQLGKIFIDGSRVLPIKFYDCPGITGSEAERMDQQVLEAVIDGRVRRNTKVCLEFESFKSQLSNAFKHENVFFGVHTRIWFLWFIRSQSHYVWFLTLEMLLNNHWCKNDNFKFCLRGGPIMYHIMI